MGLIRALIRLPILLWLTGIGLYLYSSYSSWETETFTPMKQEIVSTKEQFSKVRKQNAEAETFEKERDSRFQELQSLAEQFNQAIEKLPRSADTPGLLSNLAEISDRVGVEFNKFEPGKTEANGFLMETPFKVELRGTFVQIMSFLDEVAHLKRIVTNKSLVLKEPILRGQNAALKAEAILVTYYFDENAKAASVNNPPPTPPTKTNAKDSAKNKKDSDSDDSDSRKNKKSKKGDGE